jgi:hypothetical protein
VYSAGAIIKISADYILIIQYARFMVWNNEKGT